MIFGDLTPQQFLDEYWQKQVLFVKGALADYQAPITAEELAGLALEDEVESRLVKKQGPTWSLSHGPFEESVFLKLPEEDWTVLVQAVDLWVPELEALIERFSFLPRWRFDDVMISYATPGGSVGPHYDDYDVFLLQVSGEREWQLGAPVSGEVEHREDTDLRVMANFEASHTHTARAGDLLYIPPRVPHWGVAQARGMTFSVGFRAPTLIEMLDDVITDLIAEGHDPRYVDPPIDASGAGLEIQPAFVAQAQKLLLELAEDESRLGDWLARYMTAPKYPNHLELTDECRQARWRGTAYQNGERKG